MPKRPLTAALEKALHSRLLGGEAAPVQSPTLDLFPAELEAALDAAVQQLRAPGRRGRTPTRPSN
jgi:hypothetical protein